MKKVLFNKATLVLSFLAVACWCFYFWQKKENQEFVEETQAIIIDFNEKNRIMKVEEDRKFLVRVESSWMDSIGFVESYPKSTIEEEYYKNIPEKYNEYLWSIHEFEGEFFYAKRYDASFKCKDDYREEILLKIKKHSQSITNHQNTDDIDFHRVNWKETDDETIWFDLVQQRAEIIQMVDSITEENKKQFPTSYLSNHFEGYSTLIPDYENQSMLIKAYWFPSDTKYYSEYGEKNRLGVVPIYFQFRDSIYDSFANPTLFYTFYEIGDTTVYPFSSIKVFKKMGTERENFSTLFKVISNQNSDEN